MAGFNVLHPMGWDAFGLPAEQYAIDTGTHPSDTTKRNINRFREQLEQSEPQPQREQVRSLAAGCYSSAC